MKNLIIVLNEDSFFLSHRKEIGLAALNQGWDVTIVSGDSGKSKIIQDLGFKFIKLPVQPTGMNPFQELKTFLFLYEFYRKNKDAIFHHVGLKPSLWGGLAARHTGVKGYVNAICGLGSLFSKEDSILCRGILRILRHNHKKNNLKVIFQNQEDKFLFERKNVVKNHHIVYIKGSGVDLTAFPFTPAPRTGKIKIIFTGRMIEEKGVLILIEAANKLKQDFFDKVEFILVGALSTNPTAIKEDDLTRFCDGNYIKWLGFRTDIKELLIESSIVAFPSYYREGVPKSLIEANAIGRPIITTNSIGCKDTVVNGVNGYIIPARNSTALADRLRELILNSELREKMGKAARKIAEKEFSVNKVVETHLKIYNTLYNYNK